MTQYRLRAGLIRTQLSAKLSISEKLLSEIENGDCDIDMLLLRQICRVLGVSLQELLLSAERPVSKVTPFDVEQERSDCREQ